MSVKRYNGTSWDVVAGDGVQGPQGPSGTAGLTTKGDLLTYNTGATRLGVGTDGQVLTADSAQATGIKWASASSGGNNWVQISSPTVSGASSVSFTGLSGYKMLYLYMENFVASNTSTLMYVRLNSNSGSVYATIAESFSTSGAARVSGGVDDALLGLNFYLCDNTNRNHLGLFIDGANGGGYKWYEVTAQGNISSGGTSAKGYTGNGIFQSTTNISSIDLTFSGGTVTAYANPILYGVA